MSETNYFLCSEKNVDGGIIHGKVNLPDNLLELDEEQISKIIENCMVALDRQIGLNFPTTEQIKP